MEQIEHLKRLGNLGQASYFALSRQAVNQLEGLCGKHLAIGLGYLREELADAEALSTATDLESLGAWSAKRAQVAPERVLATLREQIAITVKAQEEIAEAVQRHLIEISHQAGEAVTVLSARLPGEIQPLVQAIGAVSTAMQEAIENAGKVTTRLGAEIAASTTMAVTPETTVEKAARKEAAETNTPSEGPREAA